MTFAGHLEERVGVRTTILLGCSIMSSGVFLTYYTIQYSMLLTTLTYGFMFGLGIALAYAPPMAVAMKWFPRKKGLVNGIIVGGFGLGAFDASGSSSFSASCSTIVTLSFRHKQDDDAIDPDLKIKVVKATLFLLWSQGTT